MGRGAEIHDVNFCGRLSDGKFPSSNDGKIFQFPSRCTAANTSTPKLFLEETTLVY